MFQKFQVKELVFLAILSAVLLLTTAITVAAVMYTNIFALRQLLAAVPFAFFSAIALRKVPKAGALSLIGILTGIVLLFILPVLFYNQVIGAVLAELIALLFFRSYSTKKAAYLAAALYVPLTLPVTVGFNYIVEGQTFLEQAGSSQIGIGVTVATVVLSFVMAALGMRVANELEKAGKL